MEHPHLDVLFEDEFSRFVADGLDPSVVVNAYRERINLGVRSADQSADVFLGGLSPAEARAIGTALVEAAEAVEHGDCRDSGQVWSPLEEDRTEGEAREAPGAGADGGPRDGGADTPSE